MLYHRELRDSSQLLAHRTADYHEVGGADSPQAIGSRSYSDIVPRAPSASLGEQIYFLSEFVDVSLL